MKTSRAVILAGIAVAIALGPRFVHAARSAKAVDSAPANADPTPFNRDESAALFVGIRDFTHHDLARVPYAADDAVDLAYQFVFDWRSRLVRADRVILALSGDPVKPESRRRLEMLRHAGASVQHADAPDIAFFAKRQSALAGKHGILIVSMATHGFVRDGLPYVLGASSTAQFPATNVSVINVLDTVARSRSGRSLVFIDACRERLSPSTRSVNKEPETAAPLLRRMGRTHGQAIFFAAAAGQFAYDDPVSRNGVFTKAVLDGLHCKAAKPRGNVTAYTLGTYVENSVLKWIQRNVDRVAHSAIQLSIDGDARNMPLSQCWGRDCPESPSCRVARIVAKTKSLIALDANGKTIWEVHEGKPLRGIAVGDLFRDHRQEVVTIWGDRESRLSIYSPEGETLASLDFAGGLDHVAIGRPTMHHAPKIIVTAGRTVQAFDPKKISQGKPLWTGVITPHGQTIQKIDTTDCDGDGKDDICITTNNGKLVLDFKGHVVAHHAKKGSLQFHLLHSRRKRP